MRKLFKTFIYIIPNQSFRSELLFKAPHFYTLQSIILIIQKMPLTLYYHPLSQPSRTILAFLHLTDVKHEKKLVDILNNEHKSAEYSRISPLQDLPAVKDGKFTLNESEAIIRYFLNTRMIGDLYYPSYPRDRALVDSYLPYHHSTFRPKLSKYFMAYYSSLFPDVKYDVQEAKAELETVCREFETVFLDGKKYIAGDILSIADIFALNELTQIYYTTDVEFDNMPVIKEYIERCLLNPVLKNVNQPVKEFGEKMRTNAPEA